MLDSREKTRLTTYILQNIFPKRHRTLRTCFLFWANYINFEEGLQISQEEIATQLKCSLVSIRSAANYLQSLGFLKIERPSPTAVNIYYIDWKKIQNLVPIEYNNEQ